MSDNVNDDSIITETTGSENSGDKVSYESHQKLLGKRKAD